MTITFHNVVPIPMQQEVFDPKSAWNNSLTLHSEQHYFLQSSSGKGKSTFIAFIIGLRKDYNGSILIDGKNQKELTLNEWSDLRSKKLGFLAQDMRLFPNLTVMENLQIKNKLTDFVTQQEIVNMLGELELEHKVNQLAGTLSLGQQQRVALIRSLLQPFQFLLMDEPFSHIDEGNIQRALQLILRSCEQQKAGYLLTTLGYDYGISNAEKIYLL
jgi:ABC-type lipoprotein export system ATPase subunit